MNPAQTREIPGVPGRVVFERFGGSWTFRVEPPGREAHRGLTFCLACHGHGGYVSESTSDWLEPASRGRPTLVRLVREGLLVGMSHAAGDAWGNQAAQDDCTAFVEGVGRRYDLAPRILLLGRSMGGPLAINLALGPLAGRVERLALLQPVIDLSSRAATHPHESLFAAYGHVPVERWRETVAPFCPLARMRRLVESGEAGRPLPPLRIWQNRADPTCPIESSEEFADLWRRAGGEARLAALEGEGHTVFGQEPVAGEVARFLAGG